MVTSALMVFEPSEELFVKVERHFDPPPDEVKMLGKSPNFDMDILNREFSCTDSILVLPKHYGTLDSEYYERDDLHRLDKFL